MQQLSGMDAAFLAMENTSVTGHVGSIAVLDRSDHPIDLETLLKLMDERLPHLPLLRKRLVEVPLGLDQPHWIEDPDFDVEFHVREVALPAPGSERQLNEQVARIHGRPLDRSRPLWEMYLISGLAGGRAAVYTKVHHAAIDGIGGAELMTQMLDLAPEGRELPPPPPRVVEQVPSSARLLLHAASTVGGHPRRAVRLVTGVLKALPGAAVVAAPLVRQTLGWGEKDGGVIATAGAAPATRFNRPVTPHRRLATRVMGLAEVKEIKNAFGVTVNDVFSAVSAGALRSYLIDHDELPVQPLVAMMPVSIGQRDHNGVPGNKVSSMFTAIPTNVDDPVERIHAAHAATKIAKAQHSTLPTHLIDDATSFLAPALAARAARVSASAGLLSRLHPFNVVLSNVPGAPVPVYLAGAEVVGFYPVSIVTEGVGLNITVQSYHGQMYWGFIACRELVPDLETLADHAVAEFEQLLALARAQAAPDSGAAATPGPSGTSGAG